MQLLNLLPLALAATTLVSATPIAGNTVSSSLMVTLDYENGVTCGQKNPAINTAIQAYCKGPGNNDLTVGTTFSRAGMVHDGMQVLVTGPNCPANSRWVPENYCNAQFHYLCANIAGPKGQGEMHFGANGCQTWTIRETFSL